MSDPKAIRELEAQLARDRTALAHLRERETKLLQCIPNKGFRAEAGRNHLLCEMQALQRSVERNEEMLAMAKQ
jgi:hypothetical protein